MMRRTLVTEWEWQNMIYEELAEKRPVIAGGDGHEIIIDGYRQGDFFHINWGWNGGSDGYFQLSVRVHFNAAQQVMKHFPYEIITGIKPTKEPFTYQETLTTTGLTVNSNTPLKLERTGNSNFPTVNTILSVRNICRDKEDKMFDFGVGIYNGEELEKVYVAARNLEFANESYIDNIDVSLNSTNVSYTRTFTEAEHQGYTTLVLPFDVQRQEAGGEAFTIQLQELLGDQPGKVYVGHTDELPMAAKPYLLRLKADAPLKNPVTFTAENAIITDSIATAAAGLYYLQGSFSKRTLTGEECFGFADGKSDTVVPTTDNCSPFRAYFQAIGMPTNFKSLAIDDQTLDPTGIKAIKSKADESCENNTYNLSGQRVSGAYKGIVIKNGIKVVK